MGDKLQVVLVLIIVGMTEKGGRIAQLLHAIVLRNYYKRLSMKLAR